MPRPSRLIFLPGAGGARGFWEPVSGLLVHPATRILLGWPGFGATPVDPLVHGIDDLVARVVSRIDQPTALIAQSMGGIIAMQVALRCPALVTHLVLAATSGGIDVSDLGAEDWRAEFLQENPSLPRWFVDCKSDLSDSLGSVYAPTLLLWGDADPISPVAVGMRLCNLMPRARMRILTGGKHDFAAVLAASVAPLIDEHLGVD
ncbi:MAG: alpha/beta fold hydrolase [Acidiferrobacterales bacterium]